MPPLIAIVALPVLSLGLRLGVPGRARRWGSSFAVFLLALSFAFVFSFLSFALSFALEPI